MLMLKLNGVCHYLSVLSSVFCCNSDGQSKGYGFASFENADGLTAAVSHPGTLAMILCSPAALLHKHMQLCSHLFPAAYVCCLGDITHTYPLFAQSYCCNCGTILTVRTLLQLAAGEEHSIRGKTVRVNRAGPRPALHLQTSSDPGRSQQVPPSTVPIAGGVSRQRGGYSLAEPSSSGSLHQSIGMQPTH